MRTWRIMAAAAMLAGPASAAQYEALTNPPDPVVQRDELIALYDEICLRAFPDDGATERAAVGHGGRPLSAADVRRFLHDDPGIGWSVQGRTGRFDVTIEQSPNYHTCAVRTMTANGFADLGPYQALAARFEQGRGFQRMQPADMDMGPLHVSGGGEQRTDRDGSAEALLIFLTRVSEAHRRRGDTAIEVRFAHQYYSEGRSGK